MTSSECNGNGRWKFFTEAFRIAMPIVVCISLIYTSQTVLEYRVGKIEGKSEDNTSRIGKLESKQAALEGEIMNELKNLSVRIEQLKEQIESN